MQVRVCLLQMHSACYNLRSGGKSLQVKQLARGECFCLYPGALCCLDCNQT